jgi:putative nucleotidyltransferase with HDIG domain
MENLKVILDKMETLPMSPSLLPKLLPYLGDVNANFDEVVRIISLEQTLTAKLLQICNSAFFGQDEPVASVAEAVNRVGYQAIYLLAAMINGSGSFHTTSPAGLDTARLWKHSVSAAFNSKFVAESAALDANLLFTAGLMHDIGKVVIAHIAAGKNLPAYHLPSAPDSLDREQTAFGFNHAQVGAALLEKWNLPPQLVACVRHHHDPQGAADFKKISACVAIGNALAHSQEYAKALESETFVTAMSLLKLDAANVKQWNQKFADEHELIASMSKLPL